MKALQLKLTAYLRHLASTRFGRPRHLALDGDVKPENAARALDLAFGGQKAFCFSVHFWTRSFWTNCVSQDQFRITFKTPEAWIKVMVSGEPDILPAAMVAGEVIIEGNIVEATEALSYFRRWLSGTPRRSASREEDNPYFPAPR